jgi:predicted ATPase/DNA-binding winged helix-turn-helix (wHTH) protein
MDPAPELPAGIAFGRFQVSPHRRELLADGRPIKLGGRAFDVLMVLIEGRGAIISREALMARVWPGRIVEENSLVAQIAALRAAFVTERELIRTVSGRGYQFTGEIRVLSGSPGDRATIRMASTQPGAALPPTNLPAPVSELIGRDAEVPEVVSLIGFHRLVTLTGAGGIGKTRLGLAAARQILRHFTDGVWLAEFSPLSDPGLVPATVAAALRLELGGGEASAERVARALADRPLLLVFDTCEHVIGAAAALAEALLRASSMGRILATSREPLRAEGEQTYPVPPLAVPAGHAAASDDPLRYGAVRLFIERVRAAQPRFAPDRRVVAMIAAICRRLDGIPLAIELAAARAAALGVEEVGTGLEDRSRLLTGGRRTAVPRHQTLRATLDWSYELLTEPERMILRRLAAFAGAFGLRGASTVAASAELAPASVVEGLANLVAKSLVAAEIDGTVTRYHLLDTTRAYALEKLAESGEGEQLARRHAEYCRDLFERAEAELETRSAAEWLADYGGQIDNLRAALDRAFSLDGDTSIGVSLTAAAVPLWMHLSLLDECRTRVERALAAIEGEAESDARREMKLYAALGASLRYTRGAVREMGAAWTRALQLAENLDEPEYQLRALSGLWVFHTASDQHRAALTLAQKLCTMAASRPDPNDRLLGERLIGASHHFLGDQDVARRHFERVLTDYVSSDNRAHIVRFQLDLRMTASAFLARLLWLQGFPDQAMRTAESSIGDARAPHHAVSLCYALVHAACPIALWVGELATAEHYVRMLLDHSTRHSLALWGAFGRSFQGVLDIKCGNLNTGLQLLRAGFDELGNARSALRSITFLGEMSEALGRTGRAEQGLAAIEGAIARSERAEESWPIADLLRVKGELLLLQCAENAAAAAEDHFRQALKFAGRQGALSLELRAATSLARLLRGQGQSTDAMALLQPVYDRFTEGFDTADLKTAKALLNTLRPRRPVS